jgi:hypothetical protein
MCSEQCIYMVKSLLHLLPFQSLLLKLWLRFTRVLCLVAYKCMNIQLHVNNIIQMHAQKSRDLPPLPSNESKLNGCADFCP